MARLLLLTLFVLLAAPACLGLRCYQCRDAVSSSLLQANTFLKALGADDQTPACTDFDEDEDRFKMTDPCSAPADKYCSKSVDASGKVIRGCVGAGLVLGCFDTLSGKTCSCEGDYCNGAGLATPALLLLLLLPSALLAGLYSA